MRQLCMNFYRCSLDFRFISVRMVKKITVIGRGNSESAWKRVKLRKDKIELKGYFTPVVGPFPSFSE